MSSNESLQGGESKCLTPYELAEFQAAMEQPYHPGGLSSVAYELSMFVPRANDKNAELLERDRLLAPTNFGKFYSGIHGEGVDPTEVGKNARDDGRAYAKLTAVYEYSRFDPESRWYDLDVQSYKEACRQDMPRSLELTHAMRAIGSLYGDERFLNSSSRALREIPRIWDLSDEETVVVTKLAAQQSWEPRAVNLLNIVANDENLSHLHSDETGFNLENFGGEQTLEHAAAEAYKASLKDNKALNIWTNLERLFDDELLEKVLPVATRKTLAYERFLESPQVPDDSLTKYISHEEAATLAYTNLTESMAPPTSTGNENKTVSRIAEILDMPDEVVSGLRYRELKKVFEVIGSCASPNQSEELIFLETHKTLSENLDTELVKSLEEYTTISNDECFNIYTQGWTGSDEETEWVKERADRAEKLRNQMKILNPNIKQMAGVGE